MWRYPVKSMVGERQGSADITHWGVAGDRRFGILDVGSGTIMSAKKEPRLLQARAMLAGVTLTIRLPNGETALGLGPSVDMALSGWLGRPVQLVQARPEGRGTYERPTDFEDDRSAPVRWDGPLGPFVDTSPVHVLTTATLRTMATERPELHWDVTRFRPNVLLEVSGDGCVEQGWIGGRMRVGEVELHILQPCGRCVMTTRAQCGGIDRQLDILRHINADHRSNLGVLAQVVHGGRVDVGQAVNIEN